jgi:hypothetical protein
LRVLEPFAGAPEQGRGVARRPGQPEGRGVGISAAAFDGDAGRLRAPAIDPADPGWSTPAVRSVDGAIAARGPLPKSLDHP